MSNVISNNYEKKIDHKGIKAFIEITLNGIKTGVHIVKIDGERYTENPDYRVLQRGFKFNKLYEATDAGVMESIALLTKDFEKAVDKYLVEHNTELRGSLVLEGFKLV